MGAYLYWWGSLPSSIPGPLFEMTRRKLLSLVATGTLGAGATAVAGGVAFVVSGQTKFSKRFYRGVHVDGEHVGGLTFDAALVRLQRRWEPFIANPVVFRLGDREWVPSSREVGISVDYRAALRDAYAWGREGTWATRLDEQRRIAGTPLDWPVATQFDAYTFALFVERIAADVARPATDAGLRVASIGGQQRLVLNASQRGDKLVAADYLGAITTALAPPMRVAIELDIEHVVPTVTSEMLTPIATKAKELIRGHIGIVAQADRWAIARDELVSDVIVTGPMHAPKVEIEIDYLAFEGLARQIASSLRVDPVEPSIRMDVNGKIVPTVEGRAGREVDVEVLWRRVQTAFFSQDPEVQVPLIRLEPDITRLTIEELQFNNPVATGSSFFWGSGENRVHNIGNGSAKIDGTILAPGEHFSFNNTVGPITEDEGFVEGLVIGPDRTEPGIGGGICQVATTLFRAVFRAGLPVNERWQHAYRVGYYELGDGYPPGFDAAISQPGQDLRFTNDTSNYLLIRREFSANQAFLRFHITGAPVGRTVELDAWQGEPTPPPPMVVVASEELAPGEVQRTDPPREGLQAVVHRTVSFGGKVVFKDWFISKFRPWAERWEIGPNPDGSIDASKVEEYREKVPGHGSARG